MAGPLESLCLRLPQARKRVFLVAHHGAEGNIATEHEPDDARLHKGAGAWQRKAATSQARTLLNMGWPASTKQLSKPYATIERAIWIN